MVHRVRVVGCETVVRRGRLRVEQAHGVYIYIYINNIYIYTYVVHRIRVVGCESVVRRGGLRVEQAHGVALVSEGRLDANEDVAE